MKIRRNGQKKRKKLYISNRNRVKFTRKTATLTPNQ